MNRGNTVMKIAVLYGVISKEREVSLSSGKGIMKALEANGHEVIGIDFHLEKIEDLATLDVDLVFIGLHGKQREDACVQGLFNILDIPYGGSVVLAPPVAMDKHKSKILFDHQSMPVPK